MKNVTDITVREDVALVTLKNSPADMSFISKVFKLISKNSVNVDMISQTAPIGGRINLSFSINGADIGKVLELFAQLRDENPELKTDISAGNCKISIFGEGMRNSPGVAADTFEIIAKLGVDIRLITTSEVDISILVPKSDFETAHEGLIKFYSL